MMKMSYQKISTAIAMLFFFISGYAQQSGSITVGGDINTFYPVSWYDGGWNSNRQTELHIGRSNSHTDSQWRGGLIATFYFHTTAWGHQANFINAQINSFRGSANIAARNFIAGWQDVTSGNNDKRIVIWLKGGGTTYHYHADVPVNPVVYDGVQNPLPYSTSNGSASFHTKTAEESYVNHFGVSMSQSLHVQSSRDSYLMGNVGIGTTTPQEKLSVNGNIRAKEVKVEMANWPDYVFKEDYTPMPLAELEAHIKTHGHLPGIPSAKEVEANGIGLAEMNRKLVEKVEELTLHLIEKQKVSAKQEERIERLESLLVELLAPQPISKDKF